MLLIPEDYTIQKFFQYCGAPKYNRHNKTYQGSCPICREGKHWLSKRRCYYIPANNNVFCHNCGWSGQPLRWIKQVSGLDFHEIKKEIELVDTSTIPDEEIVVKKLSSTLPSDSINLFDSVQLEYYKDNLIVQRALEYIQLRKLNTSVNRPTALYLSLTDKLHKNRLIIPFCNEHNKIVHYQTRTLLAADEKSWPKYISKQGSDKTLFNFNKIDFNYDSYFIFEGPLDACFCKNGIAVAGIQENSTQLFTDVQQQQVNQLQFMKRIWVLDSQWIDNASRNKSMILANRGENVFIWPEKIGKRFKDFNDLIIAAKINQVSPEFIKQNIHSGLKAVLILKSIQT